MVYDEGDWEQALFARSPLEHLHGVLMRDAGFLWFSSEAEACKLLRRMLPVAGDLANSSVPEIVESWRSFMASIGVELVDDRALSEVTDAFDAYLRSETDIGAMIDRVNSVLGPAFRIEWWGRFDELLTGSSAFAQEVRRWFRQESWPYDQLNVVGALTQPITGDEVSDFAEALSAFG